MAIIQHMCSVCKIWTKKIEETLSSITDELEGPCGKCQATCGFEVRKVIYVWRLDIDIPEDWLFGEWHRIRIYWVKVAILIVRCPVCGGRFKLVPSFLIKGTRFTLEALIFITLAKEVSGISWRKLCNMVCVKDNGCVHSTLYEAVHRIGKFLAQEKWQLFESCRKLQPPPDVSLLKPEATTDGFAPPSARFEHTLDREMGARSLVSGLVADGGSHVSNFIVFLHEHLSRWSRVLSAWGKSIPRLYQRRILQSTKIVI